MERPYNIGRLTNQIGHADLFFVVACRWRDSSPCGMGPKKKINVTDVIVIRQMLFVFPLNCGVQRIDDRLNRNFDIILHDLSAARKAPRPNDQCVQIFLLISLPHGLGP